MKVPLSDKNGNGFEQEEGYIKFPNGFILQYGEGVGRYGEGLTEVKFKKPFPKNCLYVLVGTKSMVLDGFNDSFYQSVSFNKEGFVAEKQAIEGYGLSRLTKPTYFAIGM